MYTTLNKIRGRGGLPVKLLPREPTPEMINAGIDAQDYVESYVNEIYRAMYDAAPSPTGGEVMSDEFKGHTPGPWKPCRAHEDFDGPYFEIDEEDRSNYENRPFTRIMAAGNKLVASAHDLFEFEEANARLIAAAPEMYEALQRVSREACHVEYDEGGLLQAEMPWEVITEISALLARIDGETK